MLQAIDVIEQAGAEVVAVTTPADRGKVAVGELERRNLPYFPLASYSELGLEAI